MKSQGDVTLLDGTPLPSITHFLLIRLGRTIVTFERRFIGRNASVEFHHISDCLFDIHLAGNRQNDIGRAVVFLYVSDEIVTRQSAQTLRCAYPPTFHPMLLESRLIKLLGSYCGWIVELPIIFLENDFDFLLEFAGVIDGIQKRVGLNLQSLFHVLGRYFRMVDGTIVVCGRIQVAAERLRLTSDLTDGTFRRSLEEHVLDHMGNAGNAIVLIEITGLNISGHAYERYCLLLAYKNGEPIFEDDLRGLSLVFAKNVRFHGLRRLQKQK